MLPGLPTPQAAARGGPSPSGLLSRNSGAQCAHLSKGRGWHLSPQLLPVLPNPAPGTPANTWPLTKTPAFPRKRVKTASDEGKAAGLSHSHLKRVLVETAPCIRQQVTTINTHRPHLSHFVIYFPANGLRFKEL